MVARRQRKFDPEADTYTHQKNQASRSKNSNGILMSGMVYSRAGSCSHSFREAQAVALAQKNACLETFKDHCTIDLEPSN